MSESAGAGAAGAGAGGGSGNSDETDAKNQNAGTDDNIKPKGNNNDSNDNVNNENDPAVVHRQTEAQLEEIAAIQKSQPLTSELHPVSVLLSEYDSNNSSQNSSADNTTTTTTTNFFTAGIRVLQQNYDRIRTIRGDGNCYYRAFLYALAEGLIRTNNKDDATAKAEGQRVLQWFRHDSWRAALAAGYDEMTLETFHDVIVELLEKCLLNTADDNNSDDSSTTKALADFHAEMNQENGTSDYCTWYLRVVTATHLKSNPDSYFPFIVSASATSGQYYTDLAQFCAAEVEPMGKECEQVQVQALAEAAAVRVEIQYLDGRPLPGSSGSGSTTTAAAAAATTTLHAHAFGPETAATKLHLLYRPGHYDILYPKQQ